MAGKVIIKNKSDFRENEKSEVIDVTKGIFYYNDSESEDNDIKVVKFYSFIRKKFAEKGDIYNELNRIAKIVISGKDIILLCENFPMLSNGTIIKNAIDGIIINELKKQKKC